MLDPLKGASNVAANPAGRSLSRTINRKAIAEAIYRADGISKAELAKQLDISKPAVTPIVEQLMDMGMVEERGEGKSGKTGGRKPVLLHFCDDMRYVGALDISFQDPVCAIADLKCQTVGLKRIRGGQKASPDERKKMILHAFLEMLGEKDIPLEKLDTVVICHPGIIKDEMGGHYAVKQHHAWTEIGIGDYLRERLLASVIVQNDINLAALGEWRFGFAHRPDNMIYVSCGVGLGMGIILEDRLYEGADRAAGELCSTIDENGMLLEEKVAINGLISRAQEAYRAQGRTDGEMDFSTIVSRLRDGDPILRELAANVARELGAAIYNACVVMDIRTVVFGGEYLQLWDIIYDGMKGMMSKNPVYEIRLLPSTLMESAGVYGSLAVASERVFDKLLA